MRDLGAPNHVLTGQAGDIGTGAPDPLALDHGGPSSRSRHVPSQQLTAGSAAENQNVILFGLRHGLPPREILTLERSRPFRSSNARHRAISWVVKHDGRGAPVLLSVVLESLATGAIRSARVDGQAGLEPLFD